MGNRETSTWSESDTTVVAVSRSRSELLGVKEELPTSWAAARMWLERYGYQESSVRPDENEEERVVTEFLRKAESDEGRIRWLAELVLALALLNLERSQRTRRLQLLSPRLRHRIVCRFEESRMYVAAPEVVLRWSIELLESSMVMSSWAKRLPQYVIFASIFGLRWPRTVRRVLFRHGISEVEVMNGFRPSPAPFIPWFASVYSAFSEV